MIRNLWEIIAKSRLTHRIARWLYLPTVIKAKNALFPKPYPNRPKAGEIGSILARSAHFRPPWRNGVKNRVPFAAITVWKYSHLANRRIDFEFPMTIQKLWAVNRQLMRPSLHALIAAKGGSILTNFRPLRGRRGNGVRNMVRLAGIVALKVATLGVDGMTMGNPSPRQSALFPDSYRGRRSPTPGAISAPL